MLAKKASYKIRDFNAQEIANTAWAFATLGIKNQELFALLAKEASYKIHDFNAQNIANTAWAFAINQFLTIEFFKMLMMPHVDELKVHAADNLKGVCQIHAAFLYFDLEKHESIPEEFAKIANTFSLPFETESSRLHENVANCLRKLGKSFKNEHDIGSLVVDIALTEKKIAIEVDGPTHFAYKSHEPLGKTLFKRRLLNAMGWTVISIPYWEWDALSTERDKVQYLKQVLEI